MLYRTRPVLSLSTLRDVPVLAMTAFLTAALLVAIMTASSGNAFQVAAGADSLSPAETDELNNLETEDDLDIVFKPPVIGAPGDRIGAGTRSGVNLIKRIEVLVPKGGGLTANAAPSLHWWLSQDFAGTLQVKIEPVDAKQPLLEMKRDIDAKAGIQSIDLGKLGLKLERGKIYVWKIILLKSDDVVWASGLSFIERVSARAAEENSSLERQAREFAKAGIWYDALTTLMRDPGLEKQRTGFLKNAGFTFESGQ